MSELYLVQCNKCGTLGICTQNITGEKHRLTEYVKASDFRIASAEQLELAKQGKLAWVQLCGTWVKYFGRNDDRKNDDGNGGI